MSKKPGKLKEIAEECKVTTLARYISPSLDFYKTLSCDPPKDRIIYWIVDKDGRRRAGIYLAQREDQSDMVDIILTDRNGREFSQFISIEPEDPSAWFLLLALDPTRRDAPVI